VRTIPLSDHPTAKPAFEVLVCAVFKESIDSRHTD
jgi:hypothetical protein